MSADSPSHAPTLTLSGGTRITKPLVQAQAFVIGASRASDFRIPHPSIAPRHVVITWDGSDTHAEDASGGTGFLVNGQAQTAAALRSGDVLRIGDFEFLYESTKKPAKPASADKSLLVHFRGQAVPEVPLVEGLTFGSGADADVRLDDLALLPVHATLEREASGFVIVDKGGSGLLANGRFFDRHPLLIGDRLDFGEQHAFAFDGFALRCIPREVGCALTAQRVVLRSRRRTILGEAGFSARAGEFVGIIGPSGAGKSSLLRTLAGLRSPTSGTVSLNHADVKTLPDASSYFGYVPQEEIVHLELTGRQALRYAAALRLPMRTPRQEVEKLIENLAARLGLTEHLDTLARELSGGQLKRLSVAVELLSLPPVLLLDEPTSGLDPESESQLMNQLRELTATGCTVVCTTHLMENLHLMDSVEVVSAAPTAGEPGTTIFRGKPSIARDHFEVDDFASIYERLREKKPSEWRELFLRSTDENPSEPALPPEPSAPPPRPKHRRRIALPILLRRQWDLLRSDAKNLILFAGQPVLIGLLLAVAAAGDKDQSATKLFLACIAAFWMACGNAASEIVRERAVFERERFAGLGIGAYLGAKFAWMWLLSLLQAVLLLGVLKFFGGLRGSIEWQFLALAGASLAATGIGLCISAWARTVLQAVLLVPVVTIPQILFSGYVFEAQDWNDRPLPRIASRFFPGFSAQRVVDTSLMWQQRILNYSDLDDAGVLTSYENLCTALYPTSAWLHAAEPQTFTVDETKLYSAAPPRRTLQEARELQWDVKSPPAYQLGATYAWPQPAYYGLMALIAWAIVGIFGSAILLRIRRE
jgi:ABC-type multidrug transport system ATPase subunit/pSer/pThr/pTyr-binding forkhead associated (FHA) protein